MEEELTPKQKAAKAKAEARAKTLAAKTKLQEEKKRTN